MFTLGMLVLLMLLFLAHTKSTIMGVYCGDTNRNNIGVMTIRLTVRLRYAMDSLGS